MDHLKVWLGVSLVLLMSAAGFAAEESADKAPADNTSEVAADDAAGSSWSDTLKNPAPWWEMSFDLRLREVYINNGFTLDQDSPLHQIHLQRARTRLGNKFKIDDNIEFNLRLAWEAKHWDTPEAFENWQPTSLVLDQLNVKWNNIGDSPVSMHLGRQELMLGDRWLVMDGTPLDGSSTIYFDAVRFITEFEAIDTTMDLIFLENIADQDAWVPSIYDHHRQIAEQDEMGVIAWLTNKSIEQTQLDGYFIYKRNTARSPLGDDGDIYTFGVRGQYDFSEQLSVYGNLAGQFGNKNGDSLCALGSLNRLTYKLNDSCNSVLKMDYEYASGDDPSTDTNEAFDLLWGRWPRFSELFVYTTVGENGRIADVTNMHRVAWGWSGQPTEKLQLSADYHLLFADQNTYRGTAGFSDSGCFRGQLLAGVARYQFNEWLSGHLVAEFFCPGDYTSKARNDPATFLRAEVAFAW